MWRKVQRFVLKNHPGRAVAVYMCNLFNDNFLFHFNQILKRRQNTLDSFLVLHVSTDSEAYPRTKKIGREFTSDRVMIPKVFTEEYLSPKEYELQTSLFTPRHLPYSQCLQKCKFYVKYSLILYIILLYLHYINFLLDLEIKHYNYSLTSTFLLCILESLELIK